MSQDMVLLLVRGLGFMIAIILIGIALRFIVRQIINTEGRDSHPAKKPSSLDKDSPLPEPPVAEFDQNGVEIKHKTSRLNPSFFGGIHKETKDQTPLTDSPNDEPTMNLPLTIMARHGKHFTGNQIEDLFQTFGLKRSPNDAFELLTAQGKEVLFTALNVRKPGVFPQDFSSLKKVEGLLLILQLPVGKDPLKSFETYLAVASEMADSIDGRLCDHTRRPMGEKDILKYRLAAEQFEQQYNAWLEKTRR